MGSFLWSDIEGLSEYLSSLLLTVTLILFLFFLCLSMIMNIYKKPLFYA